MKSPSPLFLLYDLFTVVVRLLSYGWFKPGTFFVSLIILPAKHELTSQAASKSVLLDSSLNTKNNKASTAVSKRQQLQGDYDIARAGYFR